MNNVKFFLIILLMVNKILSSSIDLVDFDGKLLELSGEIDCIKDNSRYYENLWNVINSYIFFLVDFVNDSRIEDFDLDDILYIKNKNLFIKKELSLGDAVLEKDFCVMYESEIYYVLSNLYQFVSIFEYFSYLESQGKLNRYSSRDEFDSKLRNKHYSFTVPNGIVYDNFFGRCRKMSKKIVSWLNKNYIVE